MTSEVLSTSRFDIYRTITDKIIVAMETSADPFTMPWHFIGGRMNRPINAATRASYRGINVVALWAEATARNYASGYWASYKQWQHLDAQVRKGERGTVIVFFKELERENFGLPNGEVDTPRLVARASRVFNAEQVDGWKRPGIELPSRVQVLSEVEAFVAATKSEIRRGGNRAFYHRAGDYIAIPEPETFIGSATRTPTEAYYAVLLHELTHWTSAEHRLNRQFSERFREDAYAMEELVAELGAAFLCADLRITNDLRPDHAAYIQSWLTVLKNDRKAIFVAASHASRATDYLSDLTKSNN